ncbi:thrombospondin type 3 repeat-containing protein [uncultured Tenacibaculum sp.]|uniref:thrombospondin type 3 repeat-containing protein n=1 Tax=uncultured Tenacibaculum sp. TaxID=174713 RepID=UPI002631751E|nr:thrombospondin type 3 repeat-containing protein [uncultured Tenacibaculum sp.]
MKKHVTLIILLVSFFKIYSQTYINGGIITDDVNWKIESSPYIIKGDLLINSGTRLMIEPGVVIKLEKNVIIQVNGEFIAEGTVNSPIVFTSEKKNEYWGHIRLTKSSKKAVYNGDKYIEGSIIKNCEFRYGGSLNNGMLFIDKSRPHIENNLLKGSKSDGIYIKESDPIIKKCTILLNQGAGIMYPNYMYNYDIQVLDSNISNNLSGGIKIPKAGNGIINIKNNTISNNIGQIVYVYSAGGSGSGSIFLTNNKIYKNRDNTNNNFISIDGGFDINIECNLMKENKGYNTRLMYFENGYNPYTVKIKNNLIIDNSSGLGHLIDFYYIVSYSTNIEIKNNSIINNEASSNRSIINLKGSTAFLDDYKIENNTINQNKASQTFSLTNVRVKINSNNITNLVNYEIYNQNEAGSIGIDAKNNFWNVNNEDQVKIYDWRDNSSVSLVSISPIKTLQLTNILSCSHLIIDRDDDLDGILNNNDNCPKTANADQSDIDNDGIGDVCDDSDGDGVFDAKDNCPTTANMNQSDIDNDGIGDVCDDSDGDGISDAEDNCPTIANMDQSDIDNDGIGDVCDDSDGDGISDAKDNCPTTANMDQSDIDNDGIGDVCDDSDGDGIFDAKDNCPTTKNPKQTDTNSNGIGDLCDTSYEAQGNISLEYISESCQGQSDGKIMINIKEIFVNYTVTLNGKGVFETKKITGLEKTALFEGLSPGSYEVCVFVDERNYTQCFEVNIKSAALISLKIGKKQVLREYTVNIASGTAPYNVYFNGGLLGTFNDKIFNVHVKESGMLEVKTNKECEGTFKMITDGVFLKKNPITKYIELLLPNNLGKSNVNAVVYDLSGKMIFDKLIKVNGNILIIPFENYNSGTYILKLGIENSKSIKILKI